MLKNNYETYLSDEEIEMYKDELEWRQGGCKMRVITWDEVMEIYKKIEHATRIIPNAQKSRMTIDICLEGDVYKSCRESWKNEKCESTVVYMSFDKNNGWFFEFLRNSRYHKPMIHIGGFNCDEELEKFVREEIAESFPGIKIE